MTRRPWLGLTLRLMGHFFFYLADIIDHKKEGSQ